MKILKGWRNIIGKLFINGDEVKPTDTEFVEDSANNVESRVIQTALDGIDQSKWEVVEGLKEFRLPTEAEWTAEIATWDTQNLLGAFGSMLKLPITGERDFLDGEIIGESGNYWSSTIDNIYTVFVNIDPGGFNINYDERAWGFAVRLIKDGIHPTYTPETITIGAETYQTVYNPTTQRIWLNKNLGATRVAISSDDSLAYGDLYQWGRVTDGHEKRTSGTTATLSSSDTPGHGDFILAPDEPPADWRSPQNDNLWQGVDGINNPAPSAISLEPINKDAKVDAEWIANLPEGVIVDSEFIENSTNPVQSQVIQQALANIDSGVKPIIESATAPTAYPDASPLIVGVSMWLDLTDNTKYTWVSNGGNPIWLNI